MIEHWYDYLPAAWFTPEGRWYVILSIVLLIAFSFGAGYLYGRKVSLKKWYEKDLYPEKSFLRASYAACTRLYKL